MPEVRTVLLGVGFLVPAIIAALILILGLVAVDFGPDPGTEVGTTLWGTWALLCGFYFKSNRFKLAGFVLLLYALTGLIVKSNSDSSELDRPSTQSTKSAESTRSESMTIEDLLAAANRLNSQLPMMIDSNTRIDSTMALTNKFQYNYTILSESSQEIDAEEYIKSIEPSVINKTCNLEDNLSFVNVGVTMDFVYRTIDGVRIGTISVTPEKCGL
jgi:hypothetical protein